MSSPAVNGSTPRQRFWPAILRIALVEILVLIAVAGAIVGYVNWSSEAAWAEFIAASQRPMSAPNAPILAVKGHAPCDRRA